MNNINEWKERWNNGDNKFVPELFELVERYEKALEEIAGIWGEAGDIAEKVLND